jgi:hypothetical protein
MAAGAGSALRLPIAAVPDIASPQLQFRIVFSRLES